MSICQNKFLTLLSGSMLLTTVTTATCLAQDDINNKVDDIAISDEVNLLENKIHFNKHRHHLKEPTEEMKARFAEKLGLTDDQKQKLEEYRKQDMEKMKPLMEQMKTLRAELKKIREEGRAHFESVLTEEQKAKLKEMHKKHLEK